MAKININCPKCKAHFRVDEALLGKRAQCKHCSTSFVISRPEKRQEPVSTTRPVQSAEPEAAKLAEATIRQKEDENAAVTIPAPAVAGQDSDIAKTIAAQAEKNAEEIKQAEQEVPIEWEEGQTILDLYEVRKVHTGGGMGLVYQVHHKNWNIDLAVKSPRADFFKTEEQKQNFIKECETWINLGLHPNIVSCYYVRTLGSIPRVFAEYVEGGSLKEWIDSRKLYEGGKENALERILDIAIQFAWGLHYAHEHEQKLIHQDVKPANVMMTKEGEAKVTDFGLARARTTVGESPSNDSQKSILVSSGGMTPAYCSPEQANKQQLTRKTDIWSWGLSVLEMFAGEVFWRAGQAAPEALESFLEMGAEDEEIPKIPEILIELLRRCFQQNPNDRPEDMAKIIEGFKEIKGLKEIYKEKTSQEYKRPEPKPAELLADGLNNKAVSMLDLGKKEEAEKLYEQALKADPHHPEATYNRGLLLWRSVRMTDDELVRQLEEVRTTHQDNWRSDYLLGQVHLDRQDAQSAVKVLESALRLGGGREVERALEQTKHALRDSAGCVQTIEGRAYSVSLSANGQWALSGSQDKTLRLWEVSSGQCVQIFEGHKDEVRGVFLSADGQWALSGSGNVLGEGDNTLRLWNVSSGLCVRIFKGHTGCVTSISLSADGRWALSASYDKTLRLWEVSSGQCVGIFQGHTREVTSVSLSADGQWALSGSFDKTLRLWEVSSGRCLRIFKGHRHHVYSAFLSTDGRYALSGGSDAAIHLWEVSSGQCLRTFKGHTREVTSVSLSADGRWALSGSFDKTLRLWEVSSGRCLRTFKGHREGVTSVSLSADGRWALSGSHDKTLRLWQINFSKPDFWRSTAVVALCSITSVRETMDLQSEYTELMKSAQAAKEAGEFKGALGFIRKARVIFGHERSKDTIELSNQIGFCCQRKSFGSGWYVRTFEGHTDWVSSVSLSADGRRALSKSSHFIFHLWDVPSGRCIRTFKVHRNSQSSSVSLSADGRYALSGNIDKTIHLWEVSSGQFLRAFEGHTSVVSSVSLSADGRLGLSGSWDKTLRLWEVSSGKCLRIFEGHTGEVSSIFLSADGRLGLSGSRDKTLRLWEVSSGKCLRIFEGHTAWVSSVSLSADGCWALSGGMDKTLRLWEVSSGKCLRIFEGHAGYVNSISLSADGRWALSGSYDNTVRLWEVSSGRCLRIFEGHSKNVTSISLSADGRWALSGSFDKTLRLWELDWDYEFPGWSEWDEGARPYLEIFLTLHCPYGEDGVTRIGKPIWDEEDFKKLLYTLGCAGYGWLRPEGVRKKVEEMTANWQGPPPLLRQK
jgi:WD40 repeat protein/serine/threonine protein kinase